MQITKIKQRVIITGITILVVLLSSPIIMAQAPIGKPQRSTQAQQTKPRQTQSRKQVVSGTINGHDYVDLGLSVKWATCNIGASSPSGYGDLYAWGEIITKSSFTVDNSAMYDVSYTELLSRGVIDSQGNLQHQYDAANQNWGGSWRMPTLSEINELIDKCNWIWTSEGGHNGYRIKGSNNNSIFLPAAGTKVHSSDIDGRGTYGDYWSASAHNGNKSQAYNLYFSPYYHYSNFYFFDYGHSIRPVTE